METVANSATLSGGVGGVVCGVVVVNGGRMAMREIKDGEGRNGLVGFNGLKAQKISVLTIIQHMSSL